MFLCFVSPFVSMNANRGGMIVFFCFTKITIMESVRNPDYNDNNYHNDYTNHHTPII